MKKIAFVFALILPGLALFAQNHVSVPLDAAVYRIIEEAETRGLCRPLPGTKPWTRAAVRAAIDEILGAEPGRFGALNGAERRILEDIRGQYENAEEPGFDFPRGMYHAIYTTRNGLRLAADAGIQFDSLFSGSLSPGFDAGGEIWFPRLFVRGDIGDVFSWAYNAGGSPLVYASRDPLGTYHTYYEGFTHSNPNGSYQDREIPVYSQPLGYFPYTFKRRWGTTLWSYRQFDNSGQLGWPDGPSVGYYMAPELAASLLDSHLFFRFGKMEREWAGMTEGGSLALNGTARPFMGLETVISLFDSLHLSLLTGVLEYDTEGGLDDESFQNAFSLMMLEWNPVKFFHIDFGSTSVWGKRFELGYLFPDPLGWLYQGAIGDYDNVAAFASIRGTWPGIGKLWASLFLDEINPESGIFEMDRAMYAWQAGLSVSIPFLPFASASLRYTKIEPYCYTHTRIFEPWYGDTAMQQAYINGGVNLGYYLPPNSDEIRLRLEVMPLTRTRAWFQYQMIRHGADHGSHAVDGSNILSELDPAGRSEKPELRKFFLGDGAYQWQHVLKIGGEHSFRGLPVRLYGEAGVVFSYYTDIDGAANDGSAHAWSAVDTAEYPAGTSFIMSIGIRIFP